MPDDVLYPGAVVPGRFGYLDLERNSRARYRVLAELENGQHLVVGDRDRDSHMYVCGATGKGKTRFLASLLLQDLHHGRPVCVLDPGGHLYDYARAYVARCRKQLLRHEPPIPREDVDRILSRYNFLNISDPDNPIRLNPLVVQEPETAHDTLEDLMRTVERLTGRDFMEQRKIREALRATFRIVIGLNELPEKSRPPKPFGYGYPLGLSFVHRFLEVKDEDERQRLVSALPRSEDIDVARRFWLLTFPELTSHQKNDAVGSSRRVLDFFIDVGIVGKHFFRTARNTLNVASLLRDNHSLFANLRDGTTAEGVGLVGTFIANKLERAASRRGEREGIDWTVPYTLYMDEFQRFCDQALAQDFTQTRKLGLRIVCAHQNTVQEPFDDDRGRSMLTTIVGMSQLRVVFSVDSQSAERLVDELLPVTLDVVKRTETETRRTRGTSHAMMEGSSDTTSESTTDSTQQTSILGRTDSSSFTYPFMGVVHDHRTRGASGSQQWLDGRTHGRTSGSGNQENRSETTTTSQSETLVERTVYATGDEERVLNRQALQTLGRGECLIGRHGPNAIKAKTLFVADADQLCGSSSIDQLGLVSEAQRRRVPLEFPSPPQDWTGPEKKSRKRRSSQIPLPLEEIGSRAGGNDDDGDDGGFGR